MKALPFITLLSFMVCGLAYAAPRNVIIIDAGSSGSRLHLFSYEGQDSMPIITDVWAEKASPALSSFATHPQDAGASLTKILNDAKAYIQSGTPVTVNILATAGMRLLPKDQQDAIYDTIRNMLNTDYAEYYTVGTIETISGEMEALYGWLDINYLEQNFQNKTPTVGSIDLGGASTQIAFENNTRSPQLNAHNIQFTINGTPYHVFSKSYLGLGTDAARAAMNTEPRAYACYPDGSSPNETKSFNFIACQKQYETVLKKVFVQQGKPPHHIPAQKAFVAYSGVFYTYDFFKLLQQTPDKTLVKAHIETVCHDSWASLTRDNPAIDPAYLLAYCANGTYTYDLLYQSYQLQGEQLTVTNTIPTHGVNQSIDWTLGALLYELVLQPNGEASSHDTTAPQSSSLQLK